MKNKRTPEIRFPGFNGNWEENKLSDIVKLFGGNAFSSSDSNSFGIPWLKIANVGKNGIDWGASSYLPDEFWTSYKDYRLYKGDYVMALTRPILNHILKIAIVDKNALLNQRVAKLIFATNAEYGYQLLQRRSVVDKIENELAGTDPPNLGTGNLKNINISITLNKDEQSKIGNFFKRLDDTIALHQQELTTLKQTKQGFLQKMFPKEGESVPDVRFPGFTGDWEERKLNDLADFSKGNGYSKGDLTDEGKPVILYGRLYKKYETVIESVDTFTIEKEKSVISKGNEVIVPASGETSEDISRASAVSKPGIILGGDLNIVRPNNEIDPVFLALTISNGKQKKELSKRAQGKSVVHLQNSDLKEVNLLFPKKEEQTKISNFFKQLDETIALYQRELDALKETKKAFLQKMFA